MGEYDVKRAIKAQEEYCERVNAFQFAPPSGICWRCREQIYSAKGKNGTPGITVEQAGNSVVSYCPHCRASYCD